MVNARTIPRPGPAPAARRWLAALLLVAPLLLTAPGRAARAQAAGPATPEEFARGVVVESVRAARDGRQTYALYLPTGYTPEKRWPVLYCFDPLGRGAVPVALFSEAAERFGWVVVGSNNSRNGPLKPSLEAMSAVLEDTQTRLSLERGRFYAAGFSGGARLAIRVHGLCGGCLAGVVAVGAGYPPDLKPAAAHAPALFAAAGTDDFNFPELLALDAAFERLGAPHRFESFAGGHAWLTKALAAEALEWMELRAAREGRRARDEQFIEQVWASRLAAARRLEADARPDEAFRAYRALAADFRGLRDASEAERRAAALGATKEVRAALKEEAEQTRRQERLTSELFALVERRRGDDGDARPQAAADFKRLVEELRAEARGAGDTGERRVARRALGQVFAVFYERAANLRQQRAGAIDVAAALEVAAELAPQSPQVFYELAVAHALGDARRKALAALRRAVENGFADAAALEGESAFARLRAEAEYQKIVEAMRQGKN